MRIGEFAKSFSSNCVTNGWLLFTIPANHQENDMSNLSPTENILDAVERDLAAQLASLAPIPVPPVAAVAAIPQPLMVRADLVGQIITEGVKLAFERAFPGADADAPYDEWFRLANKLSRPLMPIEKIADTCREALEDPTICSDPKIHANYEVTYSAMSGILSLFNMEQ